MQFIQNICRACIYFFINHVVKNLSFPIIVPNLTSKLRPDFSVNSLEFYSYIYFAIRRRLVCWFCYTVKSQICLCLQPGFTTMCHYSMFHLTWTTFKFNRNQLGTVSTYVMSSSPKNFTVGQRFTSKMGSDAAQSSIIFSPIALVSVTDKLSNFSVVDSCLGRWISILENHLSVHIRRAISIVTWPTLKPFPVDSYWI